MDKLGALLILLSVACSSRDPAAIERELLFVGTIGMVGATHFSLHVDSTSLGRRPDSVVVSVNRQTEILIVEAETGDSVATSLQGLTAGLIADVRTVPAELILPTSPLSVVAARVVARTRD